MATGLPVRDAVSAGGVVWRRAGDGGIEVVLCGRRSESLWGLPKGTPDAGETIEQTAIREVEEETGLLVSMGAPIGSIEYWFVADGFRWHKFVHHWLMQAAGGDVSEHDHEYDDVEWLDVAEAKSRATHENERRILAEAEALIRAMA